MSEFIHEVVFTPAYDCIRFECRHDNPKCVSGGDEGHGRHGVEVRFYVKSETPAGLAAIQFALFTGWPPEPKRDRPGQVADYYPMPADLGYHSPTPHYEDQRVMQEDCEVIGGPCYYDGSGLNADDPFRTLCNGGTAALWPYLEAIWRVYFADGKWPEPTPYPKPLRAA